MVLVGGANLGSEGIEVDPKVVEGWGNGRRDGERDAGGDTAGRSDDSPNAKDNFEFERRVEFRRKSGAR